jgi:hypothetical protein
MKRRQNTVFFSVTRIEYLSDFPGKTKIQRKTAFLVTLKKLYFLLPFDACQQIKTLMTQICSLIIQLKVKCSFDFV